MGFKEIIEKKVDEFLQLCKVHNVKSLYVFGSSTTDNFDPQNSDIDLLVEIDNLDPLERGENLISIWDKLEDFFNRKVDLLTYSSIELVLSYCLEPRMKAFVL